ncbi:OmpA family protein [Pontibacter actiniarum]|uniref:Flagellar motor protein MotB n=1 Tax=Pontibacter actiniarum TaxID=323450 RepID=A0A1X9YVJ2_9BACT|nr:OmpA family protein [Pontibacter actiniarum]ARS36937.1 flagellar motor protein MotB [Pontibacter actiniarum]
MKCKFTLVLALVCFAASGRLPVLAQEMKQADKYFNNFEFSLALEAYEKVLEKEEPTLMVVQRIADSYRILNNSKEAEFWYAQAITFPNADPSNFYLYAESAKRNANYAKAKQLFLEYGSKVPAQRALANRMAASCDTAMKWMKYPEPYRLDQLKAMNSEGADFGPIRTKEGLFFSSDRMEKQQTKRNNWTGNGFIQMYFAPALSDSTWGAPEALPSVINTSYHNGPADYLEKEKTLYFTRTQVVKKKTKGTNPDPTSWFKGSDNGTHTNRHGIYMARRKGGDKGKWQKEVAFAYNNTDEYSIGHPAITPDGQVLYFASDMMGGFGETDIYYSERQPDGSWGKPVNAGSLINTSGRESFVSLGADGNLYFSSDGHIGMGGLDLFKAVGPHKAWQKVENLKYPLNTSQDDFGIMMDSTGTKGLLSSSRLSENGFDDILTFRKYQVQCTLAGEAVERIAQAGTVKTTYAPVSDALLQLIDEDTDAVVLEAKSDEKGTFKFPVMAGKKYTIKGSKSGYLAQSLSVLPDCRYESDTVQVVFEFIRDTPNKPIGIENIYYDLDKFDIKPAAALELDKLVQTLQDNPGVRIELSSHTDSRQTDEYNQVLSQLRAQSAVDYLIAKGISRDRVIARGYGESRLINGCKDGEVCSEVQHQENRRTEFKILK